MAEELGEDTEATEEQAESDLRLIPDLQFPIELLQRFDAVVNVDIADFRLNPWQIDDLMLDVKLLDGRLDVERLSGATTFGGVEAKLALEPRDDSAALRAQVLGENIMIGGTAGRTAQEIEMMPKYALEIDVESEGMALRTIAANLNGEIQLSADQGRTSNTALRFIYGNFVEELYTALNPFSKTDEFTDLSCIMLVIRARDGLLDARPGMAIQTDKMNIVSEGTINLRNEKLDVNFRTAPRKKISISAGEFINPYMKVSGTLARPRLTLDPTGTLVTGGAAVATAGLSILAKAVWDRVVSSDDPCGEIVKEAERAEQGKQKKRFIIF